MGGGVDTSTSIAREYRIYFKLIVYCLETPKLVVTTTWLQLIGYD